MTVNIKNLWSSSIAIILFVAISVISYNAFKLNINPTLTTSEISLAYLGISLFSISWTISSILLWQSIVRDGISLSVGFWFYAFVFIGVAPICQASTGIWLFGFDIKNFFTLSSAIFLSYMSFIFGYSVLAQKYRRKLKSGLNELANSPAYKQKFFIDANRIFIFAFIAFFLSVTLIMIYGFHFNSSIISTMFNNSYSSTYQLVEYFVRPLLFFGFSFCLYAYMGGYKRVLLKISLLLLSISVFLIIGPLSGARSIFSFYILVCL